MSDCPVAGIENEYYYFHWVFVSLGVCLCLETVAFLSV